MLRSSMRRVGLIDITGRQRDAPRRIATFLHATLRVAPHRYATLEPLGKPGGSRAFSADGPPQARVAPRRSCEAKYMRADEFAASRRAVIERRYRLAARALINQKVGTSLLPSRAAGLILGVVCFEIESPPLSDGKLVDEQRRRISTNAAEALREPPSIRLMAVLRTDERL